METEVPSTQEIDELLAFLPRLHAKGFTPVKRWGGGTQGQDGVLTFPWPEYDDVVLEFFGVAARECWNDYNYRPDEAARMLMDEEVVATAGFAEIRTMLTYCVRGERFCDGHWYAMIESGYIRRLLQRVAELRSQGTPQATPPGRHLPHRHRRR